MDSEDALKEQAEKERKTLRAEAAQTLRTTVEETKKIEQANAKIQINNCVDRSIQDKKITKVKTKHHIPPFMMGMTFLNG